MGASAYGSAEMLDWLLYEHGIEPHVTVFDKSARKDGTFSRDDFTYDHQRDVYRCPAAQRCARLERSSTTERRCSTLPFNASAMDAPSIPGAARTGRRVRCRARSMRARATWPARSPDHGKGPPLDGCVRRSKCCSPPQVHSQARSAAAERTDRRSRRVPARSHRSEPQEAGKADPAPKPQARMRSRRGNCDDAAVRLALDLLRSIDGLLQQNRPEGDL
jgi:hypothetical protein